MRLTKAKGQRAAMGLIVTWAGLTVGVIVNVGRIVHGLILGVALGGLLLLNGLLIRVGHIRAKADEATRARKERERER